MIFLVNLNHFCVVVLGKVSLANQIVWVEARNPSDEKEAKLARQLMVFIIKYITLEIYVI